TAPCRLPADAGRRAGDVDSRATRTHERALRARRRAGDRTREGAPKGRAAHMKALRLTDEQLKLLRELAAPLAPPQRSAFPEGGGPAAAGCRARGRGGRAGRAGGPGDDPQSVAVAASVSTSHRERSVISARWPWCARWLWCVSPPLP